MQSWGWPGTQWVVGGTTTEAQPSTRTRAGRGDASDPVGISLGDDALGAPQRLGRDARNGLGDEQEVAEFEVLPLA